MDSAAQKAPLKDTRNDTENSCRRQLQILPRIYVCHILHSLWPLDPSAHGPKKGRERFTSSFFLQIRNSLFNFHHTKVKCVNCNNCLKVKLYCQGGGEEESGCTAFDERPEFD